MSVTIESRMMGNGLHGLATGAFRAWPDLLLIDFDRGNNWRVKHPGVGAEPHPRIGAYLARTDDSDRETVTEGAGLADRFRRGDRECAQRDDDVQATFT